MENKNKNIFDEFKEEYGINLLEPSQQTQEPQRPENLFEKLSRFKNREIFCDLDIAEYKRWKIIDTVIRITLAVILITVIITVIGNYAIEGTTRCNLVASPGATEPAFLGYKFTDELISEIEKGNIDLYDMYIVEDNNNNEIGARIENKHGFVVKEIKISDATYVEYSDEYIRTMFSKEYIAEHNDDNDWGYWEYTLDYCE